MKETYRILAINPGSTSTKIALFDNDKEVFSTTILHSADDLKAFRDITDQLDFRRETVENTLAERGYTLADIDAFSGRGGGLCSLPGGTYEINEQLVAHASVGMAGQHPAQLASQICRLFADDYNKRAFVVNPPDVDEFEEVSRITGIKGIYRESHIHALNQKEIALRYCTSCGSAYEDTNLIICHLGGGISITAHRKGRMIDSNDIIKGSGPMTPTRAGDMPYIEVINMAFSGRYTKKQLVDKLNKQGGLTDLFNTAEVRDVMKMAADGDHFADAALRAMVYQIAKYIGAMAAALKGEVDAVILTGGMSNSRDLTQQIAEHVNWISKIAVMPGEFELEALAAGALRVLRGEEKAKQYIGVPVWTGEALAPARTVDKV